MKFSHFSSFLIFPITTLAIAISSASETAIGASSSAELTSSTITISTSGSTTTSTTLSNSITQRPVTATITPTNTSSGLAPTSTFQDNCPLDEEMCNFHCVNDVYHKCPNGKKIRPYKGKCTTQSANPDSNGSRPPFTLSERVGKWGTQEQYTGPEP
ncbi:MAG: hypothetical protein M1834_000389 [Cirrosporium novae-zelandiae]|nr:MAG: hypothetical protein M1834_000389 [Cirrosporium novae-zelandiae]